MEGFFEKIAIAGLVLLTLASVNGLFNTVIGFAQGMRASGFDAYRLIGLAGAVGQTLLLVALVYWVPIIIRRYLRSGDV